MSEVYEIGWWPAERLPELQEFIDREWAPGHILARDADLLRWQHRLDGDRLAVVCATDGEGLKGMLGVISAECELGGRRGSLAWLTTWIVVPEARSSQLGLKLLSFVADRYDAIGDVGANERLQRLFRALGFRTSAAVPRWVRVLDPESLERLVPVLPPTAPPVTDLPTSDVSVRDWHSADAAAWDRVWDERIAPGFVGTRRDAAYLEWRYVAHPRFVYRLRVAERDGRPVALMVHRIEIVRDTDIPVIRVVEALGEPAALAALARGLVATGMEERAALADFWCTSAGPTAAFAAAGFVLEETTGTRLPSRFQPLDLAAPPLTYAFKAAAGTPEGDIYVTRSDSDMDRPN